MLAAVQAHLIGTLMEQQLWHPATPSTLISGTGSSGSGGWASSKAQHPAGAAGAAAVTSGAQPTAEQLQEALISSLTLVLWMCATSSNGDSSSRSSGSGRSAHVVMLPQSSGSSSAGLRGLCDVGQVLRMVQVASATSKQELEVRQGLVMNVVGVRPSMTRVFVALQRQHQHSSCCWCRNGTVALTC